MALITIARFLAVLLGAMALASLLLSSRAGASEMGVSYGRVADDLPDPAKVTQLLKDNGITMVRIYDANPRVLSSLANTGIKAMVMLPNENVAEAARSPSYALQWVRDSVKAYYPATQIHGVAVGNEVFDSRPDLTRQLVPAMTNVHDALVQLGLADAVKVSTPIAFDAVQNTFPPSRGRFKGEFAEPVMRPMLQFLKRTGSYLTMNIYPFWAYYDNPDINLDYALGNSNAGVDDTDTSLKYYNLLDAERDAAHSAMDDLVPGVSLYLTETHWPPHGRPQHHGGRRGGRRLEDGAGDGVFTVANAQAYTNNLINRVLAGNTGTPLRPNAAMDVYIFALFNENQKGDGPDDIEQNFGLFYPNMQKVYEFSFRGSGAPPGGATASWCVANAAVGDSRLQAALDWACGHGADCGAIQPGASCFEPDTKLAHASYAFNSYYQRNNKASGSCDFAGAASVVYQEPGMCRSQASWCVANAAVGDGRLQAALNWACSNGADCGDTQPGAACFEPNTMVAHASHAFNSYYQRKHRASGTCDFAGAASVVYEEPSELTMHRCSTSSTAIRTVHLILV
jgi:exo-beta-1,3-glucanase (GH17 family)